MKTSLTLAFCFLLAGGVYGQRGGAGRGGSGGGHAGGGYSGGGRSGGGHVSGGYSGGGRSGGAYVSGGHGGAYVGGGHGGVYVGGGYRGPVGSHGGYGYRGYGYRGYGYGYGYRGYGYAGYGYGGYYPFGWGVGLYGGLYAGSYYWPGYYDTSWSYPSYPVYEYTPSPNVTVVYPNQAPTPAVTNVYSPPAAYSAQTARPVSHDYDEFGQERASAAPALYLIAFRDQTIRAAVSYWVEGSTLRYVTQQHEQKSVPLDTVDSSLSRQLNRERRVDFRIP